MIVMHEAQHDLPLVEVSAALPGGSAADAPSQEGAARHAAELMRRGAGTRDREALDEAFDVLGASLEVATSWDAVTFSARCLARNIDATVALLADVLARPTFPADEHDRLARESLGILDDIRDDDGALCGRWFDREVFAGHAYGRTALGTADSLATLTRADAMLWARRNVRQSNLRVGVAGDVTRARAIELATRLGAGLPLAAEPRSAPPALPLPATRRTIFVDKPERVQTQITIGCPAPAYASADWLPLSIGAAIFGGTFTSRLMTEVRVKRGWSYGASCRIGRGRVGAATRLRVFPAAEQTPDTLALVLSLWEQIVADGVTAGELEQIRGYLEGRWAFEIDTPGKRLERRLDGLLLDVPADRTFNYVARLHAVTRAEINAAIRRWWRPELATIVLTGTADSMMPRLGALPLGEVRVVAYDSY